MASNSETGHAINVANFSSLISFVEGYGTVYNPSKPSIGISALDGQFEMAKTMLDNVNSAQAAYSNAIAAREVAFNPISKLITRVLNAVKASDTTQEVDDQVHSLVRKIQGIRATPKKSEEEKAALEADGKVPKEISSAQMSFDNRIENIDKLVKLLGNNGPYAPNEEELKVETLQNTCNNLRGLNAQVVYANTQLSNARIARNEILYKLDTGLTDTALAVKNYIKAVFGPTSPQYKQVSSLKFTNPR